MTKRFLLTGGRQRSKGADAELHRCDAAVLLELDVDTQKVEPRLLYESPADVLADDDATIVFKAGHTTEEYLYLCTTTEVLICDIHDVGTVKHRVTHPYFNDVHHVRPGLEDGRLIVVSTGLDAAFEVDWDGEVVNEWPAIYETIWDRFDRNTDYRKVLSTKPHHSHPNFAFYVDGHLFLNRCRQRDCIPVTGDVPPFGYRDLGAIGHDGVIADGKVLVTSVNGKIAEFDAASRERLRAVDLNDFATDDRPLGWCRGIAVLEDGSWLVGFSRLRPTRWRENLSWVKHRVTGAGALPKAPTRVACYDPDEGRLKWEVNLEDHDMGEIFSILPRPSTETT